MFIFPMLKKCKSIYIKLAKPEPINGLANKQFICVCVCNSVHHRVWHHFHTEIKSAILLYKSASLLCLQRKISLTAQLIWFSFIVKLLLGPGMVFNYFEGGYLHPPKRIHLQQKMTTPQKNFSSFLNLNLKLGGKGSTPHPYYPQRPLGA